MFERFYDRSVSDYIPIQGHVRPYMLLLDDGSNFAMIRITGQPWETVEPQHVRMLQERLNHSLLQVASDTIILSFYDCRGEASRSIYPVGKFRSDFARELDAAYEEKLFSQTLYQNETFVGVQIRPERYAGETIGEHLASHAKRVDEPDHARMQRLDDVLALLASEWRSYKPKRLGLRTEGRRAFSDIAETLLYAWTGQRRKIGLANGRLGEAMFSEHPIFDGDVIRFIYPGRVWYAAAFGMKHFPSWTWPGMYSSMLGAPYRCTTYQSFRFISTTTAQDLMKKKRSRMLLADDPAEDQAVALRVAANNLANADIVMGDYAFSHFVFAGSPQKLQDVATAAWTHLAESGIVVAREHLGLEAAFASMIPGNARYRPRPGYVSSINMTAMQPFHAYSTGADIARWGGPICLFRSPSGGTPIKFHLHAGTDAGSAGNVFMTGHTGSGKTVLAAFVIAMASSRARIFALDHKRGWQLLIRAMRGDYMVLGAGHPSFAPLKALDATPANMEFLVELIRGCIMLDGARQLIPEEDRRLALGLRMVMAMPPPDRSLGEVRNFLGSDANGAGARLDKWCRGGELGWVIDADADAISLTGSLHGFDTTALLNNPRARGPALAYIFHRIDLELDGKPLLIPIDEGWRTLLDEVFAPLIEKGMRTIRSKNGAFIFITQSPGDIAESEIARTLVEQCPVQIHLANPRVTEDDFVKGLKRTKAEYIALRSLPMGSGLFLLCHGNESQVAQLPLHGLDKFLSVLSGSEEDIRTFDRVEQEMHAVFEKFHEERTREAAE